jgi:hypothetical protein
MQEKDDKIKNLIEKSGNTFHFRVLEDLQSNGWDVIVSPYYSDSFTNKPREIDIIAKKNIKSSLPFIERNKLITINLFIECKYIDIETVFWFHEKNKRKTNDLICRDYWNCRGLDTASHHHYLSSDNRYVAKLFESLKGKNQDQETFYKAISQSLNSLIYFRDTQNDLNEDQKGSGILYEIKYPVILCNSFEKLYMVDQQNSNSYNKINQIFQLEVNYAYIDQTGRGRSEYFLIDVVSFDLIKNYFDIITQDVNVYFDFISRQQ